MSRDEIDGACGVRADRARHHPGCLRTTTSQRSSSSSFSPGSTGARGASGDDGWHPTPLKLPTRSAFDTVTLFPTALDQATLPCCVKVHYAQ